LRRRVGGVDGAVGVAGVSAGALKVIREEDDKQEREEDNQEGKRRRRKRRRRRMMRRRRTWYGPAMELMRRRMCVVTLVASGDIWSGARQ